MRGGRSVAIAAVWLAFVVLLPFSEGSASPGGLLVAHLTFLAAVAVSATALQGLGRTLLTPALLVLAAAGISTAASPYSYASILALFDLAVLLGALVVVDALARQWPPLRPWLLGAVAFAALVQAASIVARWALGGFMERSAGTLLNSNHAAAYLALGLWCVVAGGGEGGDRLAESDQRGSVAPGQVSTRALRRSKLVQLAGRMELRLLAGGLLAGAALLQSSRGALAGWIAGAAFFLALRWRRISPRARLLTGGISAAILLVAAALVVQRLATREDPYLWDRLPIWGMVLQIVKEHPLLGVGPGLFPHVSAPHDLAHMDGPVHYAKHVEATHSDLLRVIVETGLLGLFAFTGLLFAFLARALRAVRDGTRSQAALGAAIVALLVHGCVENLSARPAVSYTGAIVAALLLAGAPSMRRGASPSGGPGPQAEEDLEAALVARADANGRAAPPDGGRTAQVAAAEHRAFKGAGRSLGSFTKRVTAVVLVQGVLAWICLVFVIAPYLGHRSFRLYQQGGPQVGAHYRTALFWNPIHPDYRAALAEAVLAGKGTDPRDLRAAFVAVDAALALKPIDPGLYLLKARLARKGFLAGGGESGWIAMADENYASAARLDPHRPQARLERGWMLCGVGRAQGGLEEADAVLLSEPNSFEARRLRATSLLQLNRLEEAQLEMREAARRHREVGPYAPANPYEAQVLLWDEAAWSELGARVGSRNG